MCAILFCICDILGALSASGGVILSYQPNRHDRRRLGGNNCWANKPEDEDMCENQNFTQVNCPEEKCHWNAESIRSSYQNGKFAGSSVLQMFFILVTFSTMAIVGVTIIRGIRAQKFAESKKKLRSTCTTTNDIFASYTPLEKKLLFPVLAIVWLLVTCLQKIEKKRGNNSITPLTENQENSIEIVPMEEKVSEEDE